MRLGEKSAAAEEALTPVTAKSAGTRKPERCSAWDRSDGEQIGGADDRRARLELIAAQQFEGDLLRPLPAETRDMHPVLGKQEARFAERGPETAFPLAGRVTAFGSGHVVKFPAPLPDQAAGQRVGRREVVHVDRRNAGAGGDADADDRPLLGEKTRLPALRQLETVEDDAVDFAVQQPVEGDRFVLLRAVNLNRDPETRPVGGLDDAGEHERRGSLLEPFEQNADVPDQLAVEAAGMVFGW